MSKFLVSFVNSFDPKRILYVYDSEDDSFESLDATPEDCQSAAGICETPFGYAVVVLVKSHGRSCLQMLDKNLNPIELYECNVGTLMHSLLWDNDRMLATSTGSDALVEFTFKDNGEIDREFLLAKLPGGGGDRYHFNSIALWDTTLYGSIFGIRDARQNLWWDNEGSGGIIDVDQSLKYRELVWFATELGQPHTLKIWGDNFALCEASKGKINTALWSQTLDGYARGYDFDDNFCYVGVSANREFSKSTGKKNENYQPELRSGIWVLDKRHGGKIRRVETSHCGHEIYDIVRIDP